MMDLIGQHWILLTLSLAPFLQSIAFFIETSSWLLRGQSNSSQVGLYIGRSNIYLYSARMFSLIFSASLVFSIEMGVSAEMIFLSISAAFFLASVLHVALMSAAMRSCAMRLSSRLMLLPQSEISIRPFRKDAFGSRLFWLTSGSATIFSASLTIPMVGAIFFPNFRLSISFGSQIINFFGMLMILLFIDQILFKAIDTRKFGDVIMAYVGGRLAGFVLVSLAFIMFSLTL